MRSPDNRRVGSLLLAILLAILLGGMGFPLIGVPAARAAAAAPAVSRIMPLGDSITRGRDDGNPVPGGYRIDLEDDLTGGGYPFDFVGTLSEGPSSLADKDHEGHGGFRIDQIASGIDEWLSTTLPDVVLLMIGTNDIGQNYQLDTAPARLSSLIDQITTARPQARVVVAKVTRTANEARNVTTQNFNAAIPGIVNEKVAKGKLVSMVDMYQALSAGDLADLVHPNAAGYSKMAEVWYQALQQLLPQSTGTTYLSDLVPTSAVNGLGPYERDTSNGGAAAGDGRAITLNGLAYAKGLGTNAVSKLTYSLGGRYSTFTTDVGVDDEVGANGSVVFRVLTDGVKVAETALMKGASATRTLTVDVTGKNDLLLVVAPGADGVTNDHADWAGARLTAAAAPGDVTPPTVTARLPEPGSTGVATGANVTATFDEAVRSESLAFGLSVGSSAVPATVTYDSNARTATLNPDGALSASTTYTASVSATDVAGNTMASPVTWSFTTTAPSTGTTYLSDLVPTSAVNGLGPYERDTSNGGAAAGDGRAITLNGLAYAKGLGTNAVSKLTYSLGGRYSTFTTDVGVDDEVGANGSVVFRVFADGVKVAESPLMTGASATTTLTVDVTGKNDLLLVVAPGADGVTNDHADWAHARLTS